MTDLDIYYSLITSMQYEINFIKEGVNKEGVNLPKDYLEGYIKGIKVTLAELGRLIKTMEV